MSNLDTVVTVSVDRQTQAVAQTAFGVPGLICEFAASETTVPFTRTRIYSSTADMVTDALPVNIRNAAALVFAQDPHPSTVMVGRIDALDADMDASLNAIQLESPDWYAFSVLGLKAGKIVLSADLITDNVIHTTINGTAVADVPYATSHANTMAAWETAIETALGAKFAATDTSRTMDIVGTGVDVMSVVCTVSGGASQPTATITYPYDETDLKAAALWAESQMKIMFLNDSEAEAYNGASTTDLLYELKALGYDRTVYFWKNDPSNYPDVAWFSECLPFEPGSQTWAFKSPTGITADSLTPGQESAIWAKNGNTYTTTAGVSLTRKGFCVSGERIDVMVGVDWIKARLQERVFGLLVNNRKIPMDDNGILLVYNKVAEVLKEAEARGILVAGETTITAPRYKDLTAEQKLAGELPISFTGKLSMAVLHVTITGTVTV
jgi:hypothetical protein